MSDLALQLIAYEKEHRTGRLDLGKCGLTEVPEAVEELEWLEELIISNSYFDAQNNLIESQNTGLENKFSGISIKFSKLSKLKRLVCEGDNDDSGIAQINDLEKLPFLKVLNLGYNQITDIRFLENLTQLQSLDLRYNQITDIRSLENLTQLQSLDLRYNQITDIRSLEKITQLQSLVLSSNLISDIRFLENFTQLQSLDLRYNKITDYSFLEKITQLQSLDLRYNKITDIRFLENLIQLQSLVLGSNQITDIRSLENLTQLQSLVLSSNQITDYSFLENLIQLQSLDLRSNQITDIRFLENLTRLQSLDLSYNQITDIHLLENLTQLQSLDLSSNQITDIRSLEKITQLQSLDLRSNQITDLNALLSVIARGLPVKWEFDGRKALFLANNPLNDPPVEIVQQGNEAILQYFAAKEKQGSAELYQAKLIIVGEPGAGKTSLCRKLLKNETMPTNADRTKGIDIQHWSFPTHQNKNFTAHIWDFGGQEIYKSTHQFFLTRRSLYVLVADARRENTDFIYWLQTTEAFGDESPLLVLFNEKGEGEHEQPTFNELALRGRFRHFKETLHANLLSEKGLPALINQIEQCLQSLPHVGDSLPAQWVRIREALAERANEVPYIEASEYRRICAAHEVSEAKEQDVLSDYLHDLGVFLHFRDGGLLERIVILHNHWATEAVYKVLDNPLVKSQQGRFEEQQLPLIWHEAGYADRRPELLLLMQRFELCYEIPHSQPRAFIAPQLLPTNQPAYDWNPESQQEITVRYEYDFMPKGILTRTIVRLHRLIENQALAWKEGVILRQGRERAEVVETYGKRQLQIRVEGPDPRMLMTRITDEIDDLNKQFPKLLIQKLVPCDCEECHIKKENTDRHFFKYSTLERALGKSITSVQCERSFQSIAIRQMLDAVFMQELIKPDKYAFESHPLVVKLSAKKVFLSYAHTNKAAADRLKTALAVQIKTGKIDFWYDCNIAPGAIWKQEIEQHLLESDILILLLSQHFWDSDFIWNQELPLIQQQYDSGKKVLCIMLEDNGFQETPLAALQAAPMNEQARLVPIQAWSNEAAAWQAVTNAVKRLL